jgi:hypothetical protein
MLCPALLIDPSNEPYVGCVCAVGRLFVLPPQGPSLPWLG